LHEQWHIELPEPVSESLLELFLSHRQDLGIGQDTRRLLGREERQRLVGVVENQVLEIYIAKNVLFLFN